MFGYFFSDDLTKKIFDCTVNKVSTIANSLD